MTYRISRNCGLFRTGKCVDAGGAPRPEILGHSISVVSTKKKERRSTRTARHCNSINRNGKKNITIDSVRNSQSIRYFLL